MTPELQSIIESNSPDRAIPALLMHFPDERGWILVIAETQSDGVLRHVDYQIGKEIIEPMLSSLKGASPEGKHEFAEMIAALKT